MRIYILITLCFAVSLGQEAFAEGENDVKRGVFPYMAFIYYTDETVVDATGSRFLRSAVLIRPDWLVSSAVGPSMVDGAPDSFPRKTLLARLGAIVIDTNFTLNEDEDEQEREVIQIVRPYNHSATQWWRTDISLMKTLLPFSMTSAVGIATLNLKRKYNEKTCIVLLYSSRGGNETEGKKLIELPVELLPSSMQTCGRHFVENTMICSADSDESKNSVNDPNYCHGNSGGPLICENEVTGLQTYIENNCKQPHLYQLLSAWDNIISCGAEDKCQEEQCANICMVSYKDTPMNVTMSTEEMSADLGVPSQTITIENIVNVTTASPEADIPITPTMTTTETTTTEQQTTRTELVTTSTKTTTSTTVLPEGDMAETKSWPNEKYKEERVKLDQNNDEIERKTNVEAQQQDIEVKVRSAAVRNMCLLQTLLLGSLVLTRLN